MWNIDGGTLEEQASSNRGLHANECPFGYENNIWRQHTRLSVALRIGHEIRHCIGHVVVQPQQEPSRSNLERQGCLARQQEEKKRQILLPDVLAGAATARKPAFHNPTGEPMEAMATSRLWSSWPLDSFTPKPA